MTASTRAWMLDVAAGWQFAVGSRYVIEYLLSPKTTAVPLAPVHCQGMLVWRDRLIPLVDLRPLLDMQKASRHEARRALILGYWDSSRQAFRYGALVVRTAPTEVAVSDDMACPLPGEPAVIRHLCRSCFVHRDEVIPILDTARLFSQPLPVTLLPPDHADHELIRGNGVGGKDGLASPAGELSASLDQAGAGLVSGPRGPTRSQPNTHDELARQTVARAFTTRATDGVVASVDHSALTTQPPTHGATAMDSAEGQHLDSDNLPKEGTRPLSELETNTPEPSGAGSAPTVTVRNNEVETGRGESVLPARHEGIEESLARPASPPVRAIPLGAASAGPRTSPFRESLERRNALRHQSSSGMRRRTGYIFTVIIILVGAWYGGLIWKSHLPRAGEASRQMPSLQPESPRPEPVSVPSAPVQPPR